MKLLVLSHKLGWPSSQSTTGFATDGGFPLQMRALADLFDETVIGIPVTDNAQSEGELPLEGKGLRIVPFPVPGGMGSRRKRSMVGWTLRNLPVILREVRRADAIHTPIPGDIGTIGMLCAFTLGKPLFVRHCGNWRNKRTRAERFWRWFMERFAGGRNVMLATGGAEEPPSSKNPNLRWIFSTSLTEQELNACRRERDFTEQTAPRLCIVSRQEKGKGTDVLLRAVSLLTASHPDISLDVVGSGSQVPVLRSLANELGLASRVRFHGKLDHASVLDVLRDATLFCYPTASEGFPKAVLEALASGLPVVTTRVSVLPKLLSNGCGVLLDQVTPEAVAAGVRQCLRDAETYRRMSTLAVACAAQFSLEQWCGNIAQALKEAWGPLGYEIPSA